jgi:hypothetical protein
MRIAIVVGLLVGFAVAQDSPRVYYVNGELFQQLTDHGVTVTIGMKDEGKTKPIWMTVYVVNDSNDAVTVFPAGITLHENSPKDEELRMKTERELDKSVGHHVFWGQVIAGVGAGLSRDIRTARTTDSYGNSFTTVVNTPDYEAQARWLAWADARAAQGEAVKNLIGHDYLRATTIFQGSRFAGKLCFTRDKAFATGAARITLGTRNYIFPLPPSASAKAPTAAPQLPAVGALSIAPSNTDAAPASDTQPQTNSAPKAGVLGVAGANWTDRGFSGVEITDIAPDSAAETAGLHVGYVITDLNGKHIHSTDDLAAALSENGPGAQITIGYLVRTNLGWMPGSAPTVLTNK